MRLSVNFEQYQAEAGEFLNEMVHTLGTNRDQGGRVVRAILQAIRDRLPVNDAANFAQQLPMMWKGIFYDQFEPDKMPLKIRSAEEFFDLVRSKDAFSVAQDFPIDADIVAAFNCVLDVLHRRMSEGTVEKMLMLMPKEIQDLVETPELKAHLNQKIEHMQEEHEPVLAW